MKCSLEVTLSYEVNKLAGSKDDVSALNHTSRLCQLKCLARLIQHTLKTSYPQVYSKYDSECAAVL